MQEPKTRNEKYFMSTGRYKSTKEREEEKFGKEYKLPKLNKSLTGY